MFDIDDFKMKVQFGLGIASTYLRKNIYDPAIRNVVKPSPLNPKNYLDSNGRLSGLAIGAALSQAKNKSKEDLRSTFRHSSFNLGKNKDVQHLLKRYEEGRDHPLAMERRFTEQYKQTEAYADKLKSDALQQSRSKREEQIRYTRDRRTLDQRASDMRFNETLKKRQREVSQGQVREDLILKNRKRSKRFRDKRYTKAYKDARQQQGPIPSVVKGGQVHSPLKTKKISPEQQATRDKVLGNIRDRRNEVKAERDYKPQRLSAKQWQDNLYKSNPLPVTPQKFMFGAKVSQNTPLNLDKTTFKPTGTDWWGTAEKIHVPDGTTKPTNLVERISNTLFGSALSKEDELKATFSGAGYDKGVKGFVPDMKGVNNLTNKEFSTYQDMLRSEAAKDVRTRHANVDPFLDSGMNRHDQKLQGIKDNIKYNGGFKRLSERIERSRRDLDELEKKVLNNKGPIPYRAGEAYDNITHNLRANGPSQFAPQGGNVKERQKRLKTFDPNTNIRENPQILKDIEDERAYLNRKQESIARANTGSFGHNDPNRITNYQHSKSYAPEEGTSGYGLGASNYMKASRAELATRAIHFANPVGAASREALMNTFGVMTSRQSAHLKALTAPNRSYFARFKNAGLIAQAGVVAGVAGTALSGGDAGDLVTNLLTGAAGLQGWRIGSSVAGALVKGTPTRGEIGKSLHIAGDNANKIKGITRASVLRGTAGVVGGLTGFAVGMLAVQKTYDILQDVSSNQSKIRKIATDLGKRQQYMAMDNNFKTLTAKQAALNKLAKSGLNDRAMLLGNEARVMKGLM